MDGAFEQFDTLRVGGELGSPSLGSPKPRLPSPKRTVSPPRTGLASRSAARDTVSSSKLLRDISPTKVFTQAGADSTRISLPDLFKQKEGLASLRPNYSMDMSPLREEAISQPKLLQRLEGLLYEKLALIDKIGSARNGFAATQMRTDAHRQVFDAFLHSFTTYRTLLLRVKTEYDAALDDAMAAVFDNVHMRADLAMSEPKMDAAIHQAKQKALADAAASRKEIQDEVEQQEAIAAEAERRCQQADAEMGQIKGNTARLQQEIAQLNQQVSEAKHKLLAASTWGTPQLLERFAQTSSHQESKPAGAAAP